MSWFCAWLPLSLRALSVILCCTTLLWSAAHAAEDAIQFVHAAPPSAQPSVPSPQSTPNGMGGGSSLQRVVPAGDVPLPDNNVRGYLCVAAGLGISQATLNQRATFTIFAQTIDGHAYPGLSWNVALLQPYTSLSTPADYITDKRDGSYTVAYTPTVTGALQLRVTLVSDAVRGGDPIAGSPFTVHVPTGDIDPRKSFAMGLGVSWGTARTQSTLYLVAVDVFGGELERGGDDWRVLIEAPNQLFFLANVTDTQNGRYTVTFTPYVNGLHRITVTHLATNIEISNSPIRVTIDPLNQKPVVSAAMTTVVGSGAAIAVVGLPTDFTIRTANAQGVFVWTGGLQFQVDMTLPNDASHHPNVTDNADGTYTVTYTPTLVGIYSMKIYQVLQATKIRIGEPNAPATLITVFEYPSFVQSRLSGTGVTTAAVRAAGTRYDVKLTARDSRGHVIPLGGAEVRACVRVAHTDYPLAVVDQDDGSYVTAYRLTAVADYAVHIYIGAEELDASPLVFHLDHGPISVAHSYMYGSLFANDTRPSVGYHSFYLQARDAYGNEVAQSAGAIGIFNAFLFCPTALPTATSASFAAMEGNITTGYRVEADVLDLNDGSYLVSFTTTRPGSCWIHVQSYGQDVIGSPILIDIAETDYDTRSLVQAMMVVFAILYVCACCYCFAVTSVGQRCRQHTLCCGRTKAPRTGAVDSASYSDMEAPTDMGAAADGGSSCVSQLLAWRHMPKVLNASLLLWLVLSLVACFRPITEDHLFMSNQSPIVTFYWKYLEIAADPADRIPAQTVAYTDREGPVFTACHYGGQALGALLILGSLCLMAQLVLLLCRLAGAPLVCVGCCRVQRNLAKCVATEGVLVGINTLLVFVALFAFGGTCLHQASSNYLEVRGGLTITGFGWVVAALCFLLVSLGLYVLLQRHPRYQLPFSHVVVPVKPADSDETIDDEGNVPLR